MKKSFRITIDPTTTSNTLDKVENIISELSTLESVEIDRDRLVIFYNPELEGKIGEIIDKHLK